MGENDELSIDEVLENRAKQKLMQVVKNQLHSENVEVYIEPGTKKGQNFMGEIYRIFYRRSDVERQTEPSSLILKIAPRHRPDSEKAKLRDMFLRETKMYEEIIQMFENFQLSKGVIPDKNGFNETPKCFGSLFEEFSGALFLEDLKPRNFEVIDLREEPLTFEHKSLLLKALGKFHAFSVALRDQQNDKFNQLKTQFPECFWKYDPIVRNAMNNMLGRFKKCLENKKYSDYSQVKSKMLRFFCCLLF